MRLLWVVTGVLTIFLAGEATAADRAQEAEAVKRKAHVLEKKAAGEGSKRVPLTATIKKNEAQAVDPGGNAALNDAMTCLARTIYWESRGEGTADMEAIASVVMNRVGHDGFPDSVCAVVKQGREQGECQFSWWCDHRSDEAKDDKSYALAKEIARKALNRHLPDRTRGALYFHHRRVAPKWSKEYIKTVAIGPHIFYKRRGATEK